MGPVQYKNRKFRVAAAFGASLFIIIYGKPFNVYKAVSSPGFYLVLAISFCAALLLVELVHYITVKLDAKFGWRSMFADRLVAQVFLCVIVPVFIDLLLFWAYFSVLDQDIFENGFFHLDLPVVAGFLILLSFYYCLYYWMLTDARSLEKGLELAMKADQENKALIDQKSAILMEHKGQHIYFKAEDIFYFYRVGKDVKFVTFKGGEYPTKETIGSLAERFSDSGFLQINRSVILNFKTVKGYSRGAKRDTLYLIFKNRYKLLLNDADGDFLVTKDHIAAIRSRFGRL